MSKPLRILLLIESSRIFGRGLLEGIAKYSHLYGPWSFFNELYQEQLSCAEIRKLAPDGIIAQAVDATKVSDFLPTSIPSIVISGNNGIIPGATNMVTDWNATGMLAAQHFAERGFTRFAYCGYDQCNWSYERQKAFANALERLGFGLDYIFNQPHHYSMKELKQLTSWIKQLQKPVGLLACHDDHARHALEACQVAGVKVPDEIAILGVDNDPLRCDMADPPLSSIALNCTQAGYEAAQLLDNMIRTGTRTEQLLVIQATHVHTRQSTDVLAVDDPFVAAAIRYIRLNSRHQISVDEIADIVAVSRRSLERRFRKSLKCSVMERIRKERVTLISNLLISSGQPISRIAMDMEMSSFKYFAAYFKKETGMTPREFRKKYGKS